MEGYTEEIQQQDSQAEEQIAQATEETAAPEAPTEPVEEAVAETGAPAPEAGSRESLNEEADMHRKKRDELNEQTKIWKAKRDELNGKVRELIDEAGKCREERDSFNQKVRETKELRDEWNQKVGALKEQLAPYRNEKSDDRNEVPVKQLRKQLQDLEYTQMTKSLGKDKENEIVKQISVLAKQIEEREKSYVESEEVTALVQQLRDCKAEAEKYHHLVSQYAESAQSAHDKMIGFYEEADKLRKEADAAQAKFVECKQAADEEHRKHIEQIKSVHEIDRDVARGRRGGSGSGKGKKHADNGSRKEAQEIFERFKAGEKLSTEDLMALQKSGYL